jgi:hypothetical protein
LHLSQASVASLVIVNEDGDVHTYNQRWISKTGFSQLKEDDGEKLHPSELARPFSGAHTEVRHP